MRSLPITARRPTVMGGWSVFGVIEEIAQNGSICQLGRRSRNKCYQQRSPCGLRLPETITDWPGGSPTATAFTVPWWPVSGASTGSPDSRLYRTVWSKLPETITGQLCRLPARHRATGAVAVGGVARVGPRAVNPAGCPGLVQRQLAELVGDTSLKALGDELQVAGSRPAVSAPGAGGDIRAGRSARCRQAAGRAL
jgi:hypothetical protein